MSFIKNQKPKNISVHEKVRYTAEVIYIFRYITLHMNDESWVSKLKVGYRRGGGSGWRCDMFCVRRSAHLSATCVSKSPD